MRDSPCTLLPWSLPTFQALVARGLGEASLPLCVSSIYRSKQGAHGIFVGIFYWSGFILYKTQLEQKVSCLLRTDRDLTKWVPSGLKQALAMDQWQFCHGAPVTFASHPQEVSKQIGSWKLEGGMFTSSYNFYIPYKIWTFIIPTWNIKRPISYNTGKWR